MKNSKPPIFTKALFTQATISALKQLTFMRQIRNPVMFVTYLGAIFTLLYSFYEFSWFNAQISLWLWFTVLFANFSAGLAESHGKASAGALRKVEENALAMLIKGAERISTPVAQLQRGDLIFCKAGDLIPVDGEIIEGSAALDESAVTGESAAVIRQAGGDRSSVTAGTMILSDSLTIRVSAPLGAGFLDRIIHLVESAKRQKMPGEITLNIVLSALTLIFLLVVVSLRPFAGYSDHEVTLPILIALLVCLIPTTIGALLNAIGIAGVDRLILCNVIAKSGRAVEAAGDIDLLLLDKTGTITLGNRMAVEFIPAADSSALELAKLSVYASYHDDTSEGRSILKLAKEQFQLDGESLGREKVRFIPFTAQTRMSGIDFLDDKGDTLQSIRKGSLDAIVPYIEGKGGLFPPLLKKAAETIANEGATPLLVSADKRIIGIIHLKDTIKGGIRERLSQLRTMGIKTIMVTGDNHLTAAAIAAESGVDDYIAEATPEIKLTKIIEEQKKGHLVAMIGDGTNDAPALAQADVGVAMNAGTEASREAGNMVDLDNNPTKLLDIVAIGKQLLMTRGSLTTFSIANDVAKYFAIIPALFGSLSVLNLMHLATPQSAVLSAVIFNALIIVLLIPIAIHGIAYKAQAAYSMLRKNVLVYGLGGIAAPFLGIKAIDMLISSLGVV